MQLRKMAALVLPVALGVVCGGRTTRNDPTDAGSFASPPGAAGQPQSSAETSAAGIGPDPNPGTCSAPQSIGVVGGIAAAGNLAASEGTFESSCGGGGGEVVFQWTAPSNGTWTFDAEGTVFQTVIAVYGEDSACESELACSGEGPSRLSVDLDKDEQIRIALHAAEPGGGGWYQLNVDQTSGEPPF